MARGDQYYLHPQYDPMITAAASQYNINPNLLRGILWQESHFQPKVTGPMTRYGTAKGIAQLTDDTAKELGVSDPYDPAQAIPAAAQYLAKYRDVATQKGYANPDVYAAMVYNGGPGFKPTNRPAEGVPGPDVAGYATSVINHANSFAALASGQPLPVATAAQLGAMQGQPQPVAGPPAPGAPPGLQPTSGPLPTNWADVPGAPASMRFAPPSMFTAGSPEQQALYQRVSTPQGYEAEVRSLAGGAGPVGSSVREDPSRSVPTVLPPRAPPTGAVPLPVPQPGGPGWPTGTAGIPGAPGGPSGPAVSAGDANLPPASTPYGGAVRANIAQYGPMVGPDLQSRSDTLTTAPQRALSDEQIAKMGPEDVFGAVTNNTLTDADRQALQSRLEELQQQRQQGG